MSNGIKALAETFLIRAYFDISKGIDLACINRAYRDMNRTLIEFYPSFEVRVKDEDLEKYRKPIRESWRECLIFNLKKLRNTVFVSYEEFDLFHEKFCNELRDCSNHKLTYGQSQKWINMTIKYLVVLGDDDIIRNIKYFHIPIDSLIMTELEKNPFFKMTKFDVPWSKIENYSAYLDYQKRFRNEISDEIPLIKEFELFNKILELKKH